MGALCEASGKTRLVLFCSRLYHMENDILIVEIDRLDRDVFSVGACACFYLINIINKRKSPLFNSVLEMLPSR
jgi:hypothetical protein